MLKGGFPDGVDIEPDLEQRIMVKVVSPVKNEGGFFHAVIYPLVIQLSIF